MIKEYLQKQRTKSKLLDCFRSAGIFHTVSQGNRTVYIYPRIHSILQKKDENKTEIVFTLRNGQDPKEIKKKEYVFQQYFSRQIEIQGDLKKFTLNIYHKPLPAEYKYSFKEFHPVIQQMKMPLVLGRNLNGKLEAIDLLKIPHPLVAGETGSGKSSFLRVALTTLIKQKSPDDLEIYLADLKRSEFSIFRNVEMVKCVHHKPAAIKKMLKSIEKEMDRRSELTELFQVNHVDDLPQEHKVKYILVCIDEFVRLKDDKDIQNILIDIVSIGRTLGVICLLSMQRPSGDILDTTIRAQLTARIAFKVEDKINARIIGADGAEKLKQPGIMKARIHGELKEIKAPLLEMEDAKKLLDPFCISKGDLKDISAEEWEESIKPLAIVEKAENNETENPDEDLLNFLMG